MNNVVKEMYVAELQSKRTGKPYYNLVVRFESGYTFQTFLNDEQKFALVSSGVELR